MLTKASGNKHQFAKSNLSSRPRQRTRETRAAARRDIMLDEEYERMKLADHPDATKQLIQLSRQANGHDPRNPSFTATLDGVRCDSLIVHRQAGPVCLLEAAVTARTNHNADRATKLKIKRDILREWNTCAELSKETEEQRRT